MRAPSFHAQSSSDSREFDRHPGLIYINSNSDRGEMDAIQFGLHFREDAANFLAVEHNVIWPANVRRQSGFVGNRITSGEARYQCERRRLHWRNWGTDEDRDVNTDGVFGDPGMSRTAAACRLALRNHHCSMRLAVLTQAHRDIIGRFGLEKM